MLALQCANHRLLSSFVAIKDLVHIVVNIDKVSSWSDGAASISFLSFLRRSETRLTLKTKTLYLIRLIKFSLSAQFNIFICWILNIFFYLCVSMIFLFELVLQLFVLWQLV